MTTDTLALERRLLTMHSHLESNDQYAIHLKEAITALAAQRQRVEELEAALQGMTDRYCALVNCGDCGNWNPEEEAVVIAARATLARKPT